METSWVFTKILKQLSPHFCLPVNNWQTRNHIWMTDHDQKIPKYNAIWDGSSAAYLWIGWIDISDYISYFVNHSMLDWPLTQKAQSIFLIPAYKVQEWHGTLGKSWAGPSTRRHFERPPLQFTTVGGNLNFYPPHLRAVGGGCSLLIPKIIQTWVLNFASVLKALCIGFVWV